MITTLDAKELNNLTPSLKQGTILKKYQTKIIKNTEKKIMQSQKKTYSTTFKEGFQNLNTINGYILKYYLQIQTEFKNINNDIPTRIINALNFLVEKNGGKIIKEVF